MIILKDNIMKKNINKLTLIFLGLTLVLGSCKKFGDTNIDPTRSANIDPAIQLSTVQLRFSGDLNVNERTSFLMTLPLVQQIAGSYSNRWGGIYFNNPDVMGVLWGDSYPNDIVNIIDAVNRTNGVENKTNLNAICRIMKVYVFDRLTDLYGDLPYSEAGLGTNAKFDKQQDVYDDFFKELSAASAQLNPSKDVVKGDLFYNGDIGAWKKFANSLHLRLALRLVKVDLAKAKKEAQAAYDAGVFTSNADICLLQHEDVRNPYEELGKGNIKGNAVSASFFNGGAVPGRFTTVFLNQLRSTNDPRLKYMVKYYLDNSASEPKDRTDITDQIVPLQGYVGVKPGSYIYDTPYLNSVTITVPGKGTITATNNDEKAQLANFLLRFNAPFLHQTYAEVEFLLAEATVRFGATFGGSASMHYANGLEAACKQLSVFPGGPNIPQTEIDQFILANQLTAGREVELINNQMWVALLLNGPEAYANWRRSGYPTLQPAVGVSETGESTTIPRRFEYPYTEKEQNKANFDIALARMGGEDSWNGRVWWDVDK
ncbi:hypothetical protein ACVWYG_000821 [Pedobacter sp. UYEF25]